MKRDTAKAIDARRASCEGFKPGELLNGAAQWINKAAEANTDSEGDAFAAQAAACLVAYLEWRP